MTVPTPVPGTAREAAERVRVWLDGRVYLDVRDLRTLVDDHVALSAKVEAVQALCDKADRWHVYDTRDIGDAFEADTVRDLLADLRAALGTS